MRVAGPPALTEALRIAVERSPQLQAQRLLAVAAGEQTVAAGQLPNPVLRLGIDNVPVNRLDGSSVSRDFIAMRRIGITQELPRAEKCRLRRERLEHDVQRAQAQHS